MEQHTKTPWKAIQTDEKRLDTIVDSDGDRICILHNGLINFIPDSQEANALRIVACVNACEGIPTEAIEGRRINDIFTELTLEKNRLLEALNRIIAFNLESDGATEDWVELVATIRNARNVIAEAEKTTAP